MEIGCPGCGRSNRPGRRFCGGCGQEIPHVCGTCGFANGSDDTFCGGCGAALGVSRRRSELRHVVVLFADLEDYTRLSGRLDAEDVHSLLGKLFHEVDGAVTEHGGTIDKHIGDNVMALFGAPVAHGNDAQRAVHAAINIHQRVAALSEATGLQLRMHVGIAAGQVMASALGSAHHREYTVIGSSVNLAARLQARAGGGETFVDSSVQRAVAHEIELEAAGELSLKGIDAPVPAWRVVGVRPEPATPRSAIVGRDRECEMLRGALARLRTADRGTVALIRGEAGMGKSRLLREAMRFAGDLGWGQHRLSFIDFGPDDDGSALFHDLVDRAWLESIGDQDPLLSAHLHVLAGLPPPRVVAARFEALDNPARNRGRHDAIVAAIRHAASKRPCMIAVEDAHWARDTGRRLLESLAAATRSARLLLAITRRPETGEALSLPDALQFDLAPLTQADASELARSLGGSPEVSQVAVERAAGNPLYLQELIACSREGLRAAEVPGNLNALFLARLDRVADLDRTALQTASVLGLRFRIETLRAALDEPTYEANEPLQLGLLVGNFDELSFSHALLRDAVYASLPREERHRLHRSVADLEGIDDLTRAQHLDRADDPGAVQAYLQAARRRTERFEYESALGLLDRARELAGPLDLYDVLRARGAVLIELGMPGEAGACFADAVSNARDDLESCRASIDEATAHRRSSAFDLALAALDRAEAMAPPDVERTQIHYLRASILFGRNSLEASDREARAALELANSLGDPSWQARALSALGDVNWGVGRMDAARDCFAQCIELAEDCGLTQFGIANRVMYGHALLWLGDPGAAVREFDRALAEAEAIRDRYGEMFALHSAGLACRENGEFSEAYRLTERALKRAREILSYRFEVEICSQIAEIEIELGRDGLPLARRAVELAREKNVLAYSGPFSLSLLARLTPDGEESRDLLQEGEVLIERGTYRFNELSFFKHAAFAAHKFGDLVEYDRYLAELVARLDRYGSREHGRDVAALRALR